MAMDMRGSLNLSKYYAKPNQPKYYGKALINGVEYVMKGWEKVRGDTGEVWISLMFEDAEEVGNKAEERNANEFAPAPKKPTNRPVNITNWRDLDDDTPF